LGQRIDKFNYRYDFLARIAKLLFLLGVIVYAGYRLTDIDWSKTVEEHIPLAFSQPLPFSETSTFTKEPITLSPQTDYVNMYQNGQVVFTLDKPYDVSKKQLTIEKMIIKGKPNYKQSFLYAGAEIRIVRIKERIGLLISGSGVEGPVLRGVDCTVE